MALPITTSTLLRAPKVLLHDHLDGGLRPATVVDLAAEVGYTSCPTTDAGGLGRVVRDGRRLRFAGALPGDVRAHRRRHADPAGAAPGRRGVRRGPGRRRRRLRRGPVRPGAARRAGPDPGRGGGGGAGRVRRGLGRRGRGRAPDPGRRAAHRDAARRPVDGDRRAGGAVTATSGWSASTSPAPRPGYPPTRHLDAFEYLQRENFHFTIHAGEAFGLPSIWQAIQWCGADRLGHGVRIVDDIAVPADGRRQLGRLAAYVRDKRIPLEMCPSSNVQTGAADSIAEHPIGLLRRPALPGHGQHRQPADERHARCPGRSRC